MATHSLSIAASLYLSPWQLDAHTLACVAVLQLKWLELYSNNITGTLLSEGSSMEQVRMLLSHLLCLSTLSYQAALLLSCPNFLALLYQLTNKACSCYKPEPQPIL